VLFFVLASLVLNVELLPHVRIALPGNAGDLRVEYCPMFSLVAPCDRRASSVSVLRRDFHDGRSGSTDADEVRGAAIEVGTDVDDDGSGRGDERAHAPQLVDDTRRHLVGVAVE
jgi:hypothetical protein